MVKDKVGVYVLKGSLSVDVVFDNVQDDPAKVVKENVLAVVNDKASDALKNKPVDVKEKLDGKGKKVFVVNDKVVKDSGKDVELPKDKPKNNVPDVVKERLKTELPKEKPRDKPKAHSEVPVAEKSTVV
ncbi:hypothetical protein Tco_0504934 [Tanacetum coccineum]